MPRRICFSPGNFARLPASRRGARPCRRPKQADRGTASIGHANTVAKAITRLGGTPHWSFGAFPVEMDLKKIFDGQLEKEKLALKLHQQIVGMITDYSIRNDLSNYLKKKNRILERLKKSSNEIELIF